MQRPEHKYVVTFETPQDFWNNCMMPANVTQIYREPVAGSKALHVTSGNAYI